MSVDLTKLHPVLQKQVELFIKFSPVPIRVTQGLRTMEEQQALYDQGRTKPGKIVTQAKPGDSAHNYGMAFDIAGADGGYNLPWEDLGLLAESLGMYWGGRWTDFPDKPHFGWDAQCDGERMMINALKKGYKPQGSETVLAYLWARENKIFTDYTRPDDRVTAEKLAVFLQRFSKVT